VKQKGILNLLFLSSPMLCHHGVIKGQGVWQVRQECTTSGGTSGAAAAHISDSTSPSKLSMIIYWILLNFSELSWIDYSHALWVQILNYNVPGALYVSPVPSILYEQWV
jgi:hypothetical protein